MLHERGRARAQQRVGASLRCILVRGRVAMARARGVRLDVKRIISSQFMRDLPLVVAGCAIAALGIDAFMVPNGLAAGGVTGLATIIAELGARAGVLLPVGVQTRRNEDLPYWPPASIATYREVWTTPPGRWMWIAADLI